MRYLLDTQLILWSSAHSQRLSSAALKILRDRANPLLFSGVSIWEIAIKRGLNKPEFQIDPDVLRNTMLRQGLEEITVLGSHALAVAPLPPIHKLLKIFRSSPVRTCRRPSAISATVFASEPPQSLIA